MRGLSVLALVTWASIATAQTAEQPAEGAADTPAAATPDAPAAADPAPAGAPDRAGEAEAKPAPPPADPNTTVEVEKTDAEKAAAAPETGEEAYRLKISELESRVNDLKEKIFRSKTRLAILKETVLSSSIAGAEAAILHRNEMGSSFRLEKASYSLDGQPMKTYVDDDNFKLADQPEIEVFNGPITPGNHTVSVVMTYRGNGFGIFSYLRGYVFNLRSSHTFHAEEGKLVHVRVVGYEKGGITTDLKDRPDIRFEDQLSESARRASAVKATASE